MEEVENLTVAYSLENFWRRDASASLHFEECGATTNLHHGQHRHQAQRSLLPRATAPLHLEHLTAVREDTRQLQQLGAARNRQPPPARRYSSHVHAATCPRHRQASEAESGFRARPANRDRVRCTGLGAANEKAAAAVRLRAKVSNHPNLHLSVQTRSSIDRPHTGRVRRLPVSTPPASITTMQTCVFGKVARLSDRQPLKPQCDCSNCRRSAGARRASLMADPYADIADSAALDEEALAHRKRSSSSAEAVSRDGRCGT